VFAEKGVVAFTYFDYKEQQRQTHIDVAASLLKQLVENSSFQPDCSALLEALEDRLNRGPIHGAKELTKFILQWTKTPSRIFIILDALDECEPHVSRPKILNLINILGAANVKVLVMSRQKAPLECQSALTMTIIADSSDIDKFLNYELEAKPIPVVLKAEITKEIISSANGM
jgi:hypothetical protein